MTPPNDLHHQVEDNNEVLQPGRQPSTTQGEHMPSSTINSDELPASSAAAANDSNSLFMVHHHHH